MNYQFKRTKGATAPVVEGANVLRVQAVDEALEASTKDYSYTVPAATRTFSYDANGNTLNDGQRFYTWDHKDRLDSVTSGGTTRYFKYVSQGRMAYELKLSSGGNQPESDQSIHLERRSADRHHRAVGCGE